MIFEGGLEGLGLGCTGDVIRDPHWRRLNIKKENKESYEITFVKSNSKK